MGRKKDNKQELIKKRMRTLAWYQHIVNVELDEKNLIKSLELSGTFTAQELDSFKQMFRNYHPNSLKKHGASLSTVNRIEQLIPGSKNVFDNGPGNSFMFISMFEENFGLSEKKNFCQDSKKTFNDLTELIQSFRDSIIKKQYESYTTHVEDLVASILIAIETEKVKRLLSNYHIYDLFLKWLYVNLIDWCTISNSFSNKLFINGHFPTEEQFVNDPKLFFRVLLKDITKEPDYSNILGSTIEVAKFLERKAVYWLPDENYLKVQRKNLQPENKDKRTKRILAYAKFEQSTIVKRINRGTQVLSGLLIVFFLVISFLFSIHSMTMELGTTLFCLSISSILLSHVTSTINKQV